MSQVAITSTAQYFILVCFLMSALLKTIRNKTTGPTQPHFLDFDCLMIIHLKTLFKYFQKLDFSSCIQFVLFRNLRQASVHQS